MTSREKALELYHRYRGFNNETPKINKNTATQCALICINEIIDQWEYIDTYLADLGGKLNPNLKYWLEVKQELLKL